MATGLEAYDALKSATQGMPDGSAYTLSKIERRDLGKLSVTDLLSRGYDEKVAEEVSTSLMNGSVDLLGKSMGLSLTVK